MFIYIYIYREREREGEKERERERERETVSSSCKHVCASKGRIILSNKSIFSKKSHAPHTSCSQRIVEPSWRPNKRGTFLSVPPHLVIEVCICLISLESDVPVRSQVCCASSTNARPILGCRSAACDTCLHVCVSQCRSKQVACAYALAGGGGGVEGGSIYFSLLHQSAHVLHSQSRLPSGLLGRRWPQNGAEAWKVTPLAVGKEG